jgi:hypothetical protein
LRLLFSILMATNDLICGGSNESTIGVCRHFLLSLAATAHRATATADAATSAASFFAANQPSMPASTQRLAA